MEEFHWKYPMSWLKFGRVSKWKVTTETFHLTEMAQTVGRERLLQFALVFWLNKAPDFFLNKTVETLRFLNNFSLRLKILQNFSLHYNDNSKAASCRLQVADGICRPIGDRLLTHRATIWVPADETRPFWSDEINSSNEIWNHKSLAAEQGIPECFVWSENSLQFGNF